MVYKTRTGVVMIQVCGQHILAATRPIWSECARLRPIPKSWAVCWNLMGKDKTDTDVIRAFVELFHKSEDEVRERFEKVFHQLAAEGFLIEVPDEDDEKDGV